MYSKLNKNLARILVKKLYTENIKEIVTAKYSSRNRVFIIHTIEKESDVVVRITDSHSSLNNYLKEQWCIITAEKVGIPVPNVLEVSNHIIPYPYFVAKFKRGIPANKCKNKKELYLEMGKIMKAIHSISTSGFGSNFDWSSNNLSKIKSWKVYMSNNFKINEAINIYKKYNIIPEKYLDRMKNVYEDYIEYEFSPVLCHNDFIDKNILVNQKGKIISVLDWELAISSHPYRDLGKTWRGILYYSNCEMVKYFFEGYGIQKDEYIKNKDYMFIFDFIIDSHLIDEYELQKDENEIDKIKKFWIKYFEEKNLY